MKAWWWGLGVVLLASRVWALSGTTNEITVQDGTIGLVDPLIVAKGGTGVASLTDRAVILGRGTAAVEFASPANAGGVLLSAGAAANPVFGAVDLADSDARTGTLPVGNGGSGAATFTANGVLMGNTTSAFQVSAAGTSGQPFLSGGAGAPGAYGNLDLSTSAATGTLDVPNGGTGATSFTGSRCIRSNSGGTALEVAAGDCATATGAPIINFGSFMPISAGTTVYVAPGNGVDQTESIVRVPMPAATFTNMRCEASTAPGGSDTLTVTARAGACGSMSNDADFICTISASGTTCSDTDSVSTTAGQCLSFSIVSSATAATSAVKCSAERSA